jgi:hypothetical protein
VHEYNSRSFPDHLDLRLVHGRKDRRLPGQAGTASGGIANNFARVNKVGRKRAVFMEKWPLWNVTSSDMLAAMEPSRPTFRPAGAGMLLAATTAASVGTGALVGWAAGSVGFGILGGAVVGVPAGIAAVYFRYREALS